MITLDKEALRLEREQCLADLEVLKNLWGIPQSVFDANDGVIHERIARIVEHADTMHQAYLSLRHWSYGEHRGLEDREDHAYKYLMSEHRRALGSDVQGILIGLYSRALTVTYLLDVVGVWDLREVRTSEITHKAYKHFANQIQGSIGWSNNVIFKTEHPVGTRRLAQKKVSINGYANYGSTAIVGISDTWDEDVYAKGLSTIEFQSKYVMPLSLKVVPNAELTAEGVTLYKGHIAYTYVPRANPATFLETIRTEEKYIAVQYSPEGRPAIIATGKDESWAVRTMKGRLRSNLLNQLDL